MYPNPLPEPICGKAACGDLARCTVHYVSVVDETNTQPACIDSCLVEERPELGKYIDYIFKE